MWLPCNFGEIIRLREHKGYEYEECAFIGLTVGLFNGGATYLFSKLINNKVSKYQSDRLVVMDLKNEISFWPNAFNNLDSYDQSSLNDGEIELEINIGSIVKYNRYFLDSKSFAQGRCVSISRLPDGAYRYSFQGSDGLGKYFITPELFIKKPFISYDEELLS